MLLPVIGAGLGGLEAYRRTGGDIGATLLGAGLGAAVPGGLRMAGTALGGTGLASRLGMSGAEALRSGARGLTGAASGLGKQGLEGAARAAAAAGAGGMRTLAGNLTSPAAIGGLAAGTGVLLGAPALAGALASNVAPPARTAAQLGAGTAGYQAPGEVDYSGLGGGAVPPVGTFGAGGTLSDPLNVLGRVGMAQRLETLKSAEAQRDAMRLLLPEVMKAGEASKKAEFQRQLAAAGVRQNIMTAANMLERSQQAAQQMGLTAASQAGQALTQQYQYS
jgi:hypothetical protein